MSGLQYAMTRNVVSGYLTRSNIKAVLDRLKKIFEQRQVIVSYVKHDPHWDFLEVNTSIQLFSARVLRVDGCFTLNFDCGRMEIRTNQELFTWETKIDHEKMVEDLGIKIRPPYLKIESDKVEIRDNLPGGMQRIFLIILI